MPEPDDRLDAESTRRLLERQGRLQREAREVLADLGLIACLERVGRPMLVGSVVSGLMVWPDIDFNIVCRDPRPGPIADAMRPLFDHPAVRRVSYHNLFGAFNAGGNPRDEGFYWGIYSYAGGDPANPLWKIDCWFLPEGAPRGELDLLARLNRELTDEARLAVLWIKDEWHDKPSYRDTVLSVDIYDAVLDHGARTPPTSPPICANAANPPRRRRGPTEPGPDPNTSRCVSHMPRMPMAPLDQIRALYFHSGSVVPIVRRRTFAGVPERRVSSSSGSGSRRDNIVVSTKKTSQLQQAFDSGSTYDDYAAKIRAEGGRPAHLLDESEATLANADIDLAPFQHLTKPLNVLVLSETWCPDCTDNLPILDRIANESGKLNVRIVGRDEHPEVADAHLKEGKFRSIPTFIFFDQNGNEVGTFIERPASVTELRQQRRRAVYAQDASFGSPDAPASELPDEVRATLEPRLTEARASTRDFAIQEVARELGEIVAGA